MAAEVDFAAKIGNDLGAQVLTQVLQVRGVRSAVFLDRIPDAALCVAQVRLADVRAVLRLDLLPVLLHVAERAEHEASQRPDGGDPSGARSWRVFGMLMHDRLRQSRSAERFIALTSSVPTSASVMAESKLPWSSTGCPVIHISLPVGSGVFAVKMLTMRPAQRAMPCT